MHFTRHFIEFVNVETKQFVSRKTDVILMPLSPLLIQLRTVSNMTAYGERLGDDAMGVQGSRARLVGMLAGGVWFRVVRSTVITPADVDASVLHSAVHGGVERPL